LFSSLSFVIGFSLESWKIDRDITSELVSGNNQQILLADMGIDRYMQDKSCAVQTTNAFSHGWKSGLYTIGFVLIFD